MKASRPRGRHWRLIAYHEDAGEFTRGLKNLSRFDNVKCAMHGRNKSTGKVEALVSFEKRVYGNFIRNGFDVKVDLELQLSKGQRRFDLHENRVSMKSCRLYDGTEVLK